MLIRSPLWLNVHPQRLSMRGVQIAGHHGLEASVAVQNNTHTGVDRVEHTSEIVCSHHATSRITRRRGVRVTAPTLTAQDNTLSHLHHRKNNIMISYSQQTIGACFTPGQTVNTHTYMLALAPWQQQHTKRCAVPDSCYNINDPVRGRRL